MASSNSGCSQIVRKENLAKSHMAICPCSVPLAAIFSSVDGENATHSTDPEAIT